jgi:hypothetical protein
MSKCSDAEILETLRAVANTSNHTDAGALIGINRRTVGNRVKDAGLRGLVWPPKEPFEHDELPDEIDLPALVARRKAQFAKKSKAELARRLIGVKISIDGPIGILHMGDPHVDDDGTDIAKLEADTTLCRETEGLFAATVGDLQNNWIGRLARLYAEQSTSAAESWALTEWLVNSVDWIYMIGGNHDCWSGAGDPLKWITKHSGTLFENHSARLNLKFPSGAEIRVNARHDFSGHSMWNPAHGIAKAVQMGWRDHILTCGHKHISGYQILKDPNSKLVSHAIRVAGYKTFDRYATEKGLPDQTVSPSVVTVIDPYKDDSDAGQVTVYHDVEEGAEFLKWKRSKQS